MSKLRCHISISLDGFVAGPKQSDENPLGEGGERLHDWVVPLAAWREPHGKKGGDVNESTRVMQEAAENIGAAVMGRNMFGPPAGGDWATRSGRARGGTTRRTTTTSSSSPITRAIRSRWKEGHVSLRHRRNREGARTGEGGRERRGREAVGRGAGDPGVPDGGATGRARASRRPRVARRR